MNILRGRWFSALIWLKEKLLRATAAALAAKVDFTTASARS
jgi:hypothetical protein